MADAAVDISGLPAYNPGGAPTSAVDISGLPAYKPTVTAPTEASSYSDQAAYMKAKGLIGGGGKPAFADLQAAAANATPMEAITSTPKAALAALSGVFAPALAGLDNLRMRAEGVPESQIPSYTQLRAQNTYQPGGMAQAELGVIGNVFEPLSKAFHAISSTLSDDPENQAVIEDSLQTAALGLGPKTGAAAVTDISKMAPSLGEEAAAASAHLDSLGLPPATIGQLTRRAAENHPDIIQVKALNTPASLETSIASKPGGEALADHFSLQQNALASKLSETLDQVRELYDPKIDEKANGEANAVANRLSKSIVPQGVGLAVVDPAALKNGMTGTQITPQMNRVFADNPELLQKLNDLHDASHIYAPAPPLAIKSSGIMASPRAIGALTGLISGYLAGHGGLYESGIGGVVGAEGANMISDAFNKAVNRSRANARVPEPTPVAPPGPPVQQGWGLAPVTPSSPVAPTATLNPFLRSVDAGVPNRLGITPQPILGTTPPTAPMGGAGIASGAPPSSGPGPYPGATDIVPPEGGLNPIKYTPSGRINMDAAQQAGGMRGQIGAVGDVQQWIPPNQRSPLEKLQLRNTQLGHNPDTPPIPESMPIVPLPEGVSMKVFEPTEDTLSGSVLMNDKEGNPLGEMMIRKSEDGTAIRQGVTQIHDPANQGQGLGTAMLQHGIDYAHLLGLNFESDTLLSKNMSLVFPKLKELGYNVQMAPDIVKDGMWLKTQSGDPVFTVPAPGKSSAGVVVGQTKLPLASVEDITNNLKDEYNLDASGTPVHQPGIDPDIALNSMKRSMQGISKGDFTNLPDAVKDQIGQLNTAQKLQLQSNAQDYLDRVDPDPIKHSVVGNQTTITSDTGADTAMKRGDVMQVINSDVAPTGQGFSEAQERLQRIVDISKQQGLKSVASDTQMSKTAASVWSDLRNRGAPVIKNRQVQLQGDEWVSTNGQPIFSIKLDVKPNTPPDWLQNLSDSQRNQLYDYVRQIQNYKGE